MIRRTAVTANEDELLLRPATIAVVNSLKKHLGIGKDVIVKYDGKELTINTDDGVKGLNDSPMEVIEIDTRVDSLEGGGILRGKIDNEETPFFKHDESGSYLHTVYSDSALVFEFKHKTKFKSRHNVMNTNLLLQKNTDSLKTNFSFEGAFALPLVIKTFINMVFTHTHEVDGLDAKGFSEKCFTGTGHKTDFIEHLSGKKDRSELVIRKNYVDLEGLIIGDIKEKPTDKEGQYHVISFEYRTNFSRPMAIQSTYNMLIYNNQLMDLFYNKPPVEYNSIKHTNGYEHITKLLRRDNSFGLNTSGYYLTVPSNDEYELINNLSEYYPVLTVLTTYDEGEVELFNLDDISEIKFKKTILDFIKVEHEYVTRPFMSLFYFALYKDDKIDTTNRLCLDEDLNFTTLNKMDVKGCYRVVLYICRDVTQLKANRRKAVIDFCNDEIERCKDMVRKPLRVGQQAHREGPSETEGVGLEQQKTHDLLLDVYFNFFNIPDEELYNSVKKVSTQSTAEAMFKVQIPDFSRPKFSATHTTIVSKMFEEGED